MKSRILVVSFAAILCCLAAPAFAQTSSTNTVAGSEIAGAWTKVQKNNAMGDNTLSIDLAARTVSFSYQGHGALSIAWTDLAVDTKADMPRVTLTLGGAWAGQKLVILAFSDTQIYVGSLGKLQIWGAYRKQAK